MSDCHQVDTINDAADYKLVQKSLDTLGFSRDDKDFLSKIVAGILHLGNIKFQQEGKEMKVVNTDGMFQLINYSIFLVAHEVFFFSYSFKYYRHLMEIEREYPP